MTERDLNKLRSELHKMTRERFMDWLKNMPATPENFGVLRVAMAEVFYAWLDEETQYDSLKREVFGVGMYDKKKPRK